MKVSKHAKRRMKERTNYNHKERNKLFKEALKKGIGPGNIKKGDSELKKYLNDKVNCKAKIYKGYVFIYSKHSHQLYTMYECPEHIKKIIEGRYN